MSIEVAIIERSLEKAQASFQVPHDQLADFCRRNDIRWLALFGSAVRDDFGPESDVDVLVEFEPEARVTMMTIGSLQRE